MSFKEMRLAFEGSKNIYESSLLTFKGVDGYDVYNCSLLFQYKGKHHLFGRFERREKSSDSRVRLFVETGKDEYTVVPDQLTYQLEDPFVSKVQGSLFFGGTQVIKSGGNVTGYFCDFYHGMPQLLTYYTTGPDLMRSIRIVQLADGTIGIFSCHKTEGSCLIGFTTVNSLNEVTREVIAEAKPINNAPFLGAWGGVNQAYLLSSGNIGCICHHGYLDKDANGEQRNVCCITSFVYDPKRNNTHTFQLIGTRGCFPDCPSKSPSVADCAFASGIVMREDGKCDLYSGLGDTHEGRITIDYPFKGYGTVVNDLVF
ncbi:conserved hypothetical protein [Leishmania major strain Friedlin]|uniref:Uncharacterized protein n=1 Tax=Leishmania major TaxID=5664 RepID=Q4QH85_LEIMA|nr:conserved hypothetical protein [Leishmania major strain Friedlin]CAG9570117.1 Protein_of_unknown_function_(DUF1861)_-_putative [Leishmania major strain Friedlin]CAJ03088.1 conserved hypothetical protein [Leishmania major strain Friedlin]|eukprot:XP_001681463.1 conserved hypothetical protein [Leishmania major strain Friedlin]